MFPVLGLVFSWYVLDLCFWIKVQNDVCLFNWRRLEFTFFEEVNVGTIGFELNLAALREIEAPVREL